MELLFKEEEISWKSIIYDMVKTGEINPWDVNITLLTKKYIEVIKQLKEHDLKVSGKVLLAAALLLKIKSAHLLEHDITRLDALLNFSDDQEAEPGLFEDGDRSLKKEKGHYVLIPRNPQPRNRKVSVQDLVEALQRAMSSKKKVLERLRPEKFSLPERSMEIMEAIDDLLQKITYYSKQEQNLTFARLLPPRAGRAEKVFTFVPLLHLEHEKKVQLLQEQPFEEIKIRLFRQNKE